ncbi:MAG: glycosyl hydrolase family 65 protein, partial [Cyclobacteriaceae bacterium]
EKYPGAEDGGIKDNAYTNIMVAWLFNRANELIEALDDDTRRKIFSKIDIDEKEINLWNKIAESFHLEISEEGIIAQFEGFFNLKDIDFSEYKKKYGDIHRMDRILKAEDKSPDDYKVAKQADTLMIFYNLPVEVVTGILEKAGYNLPENYVEKNYEYYLNHCSHGSTLSRVVYSYLSHLTGRYEDTRQLYREALLSDYVDIQGGTTGEGIHAGVMGGTIYLALSMFAGIDLRRDKITINPDLPTGWDGMNFEFNFKNVHYVLEIQRDKLNIEITSPGKDEVEVWIRGKKHLLKTSEKNQVAL